MTPFETAVAEIDLIEARQNGLDEYRISNPAFVAWLNAADATVAEWRKALPSDMTLALLVHCIQIKHLRFVMTHMPNTMAFTRGNFVGDWGVQINPMTCYEKYFPEAKKKRLASEKLSYSKLCALVEEFYRDNLTPDRIIERIKQRHPHQPFNERTVRNLAKRSIDSLRSEIVILKKS